MVKVTRKYSPFSITFESDEEVGIFWEVIDNLMFPKGSDESKLFNKISNSFSGINMIDEGESKGLNGLKIGLKAVSLTS